MINVKWDLAREASWDDTVTSDLLGILLVIIGVLILVWVFSGKG